MVATKISLALSLTLRVCTNAVEGSPPEGHETSISLTKSNVERSVDPDPS